MLPTKKTVAEKEAKPAKPLKQPDPEEWIIDIPDIISALDLYAPCPCTLVSSCVFRAHILLIAGK